MTTSTWMRAGAAMRRSCLVLGLLASCGDDDVEVFAPQLPVGLDGEPYAVAGFGEDLIVVGTGRRAADPQRGRDVLVARFDADLALDPTFGDSGVALHDVSGLGRGPDDVALAVTAVGDDLWIAGFGDGVAGAVAGRAMVARLDADGRLSTAFGDGGVVLTGFGGETATSRHQRVGFGPSDRLVAGGRVDGVGYLIAPHRLDGSPDSGFGSATPFGAVFADDGGSNSGGVVGLFPRNGGAVVLTGGPDMGASRLLPSGGVDARFGTQGFDRYDAAPPAHQALDLGDEGSLTVGVQLEGQTSTLVVVKRRPNGTRDPEFGTDGRLDVGLPRAVEMVRGLGQDAPTSIIVYLAAAGPTYLARVALDGTLDASFGTEDGLRQLPLRFEAPPSIDADRSNHLWITGSAVFIADVSWELLVAPDGFGNAFRLVREPL